MAARPEAAFATEAHRRAVLAIARQALDALFFLHRECQLLHCDLCPEHLWVVEGGDGVAVKIGGFGAAIPVKGAKNRPAAAANPFLPADVASDERAVFSEQTDLYSLGKTLAVAAVGLSGLLLSLDPTDMALDDDALKKALKASGWGTTVFFFVIDGMVEEDPARRFSWEEVQSRQF